MVNNLTDISNVLVIGCGGAGLRAAIEAKINGLQVKILGKRPKNDSHTVLAAGGINASLANIDKQDCWEQHFADTYLEGYGLADPKLLEILVKEAPNLVNEIDMWGANFERIKNGLLDQRYFGAHTYRRTCYSGDYTGKSILNALLRKASSLNIPIFDSQYVTELLIIDQQCFGAFSFNLYTGERTIHYADAVILSTGGHTRIWKRSSSRRNENNGDGYYLALKAGCELIDMEMVQFHPTGMLFPEEMSGTLVTEAVRGEGGILKNCLGDRYMRKYDPERMELSTRDKVAIANYKEIEEGRGTSNGGVYLHINHKDKDFIQKKLPKIYRQFIEHQMLDISKNPMEVAPTAHYSMGGIMIYSDTQSSSIKGLFAAGEVTGGIHGANRLGGNSLAEILVFGKIAGRSASLFSKNLKSHNRSRDVVLNANENIDKLIKKGSELALPLQNELQNIMWKYCGVIKNQINLEKAQKKINEIKSASEAIEVNLNDGEFNDLSNTFNLLASIQTAEATILSSLQRKESRGAHQRDDYKEIDYKENKNYIVCLKNDEILIKDRKTEPLSNELCEVINKTKKIIDFESRLLE